VKGRRLSKRARTRCATEIDASSARVTNRWKASRTRESTVLQWSGGTSGLDQPDRCFARSSVRRRPDGDEASDPSPSTIARSREHSVRRLDPLAEVSPFAIEARGSAVGPALRRKTHRWLPGAWVLVFDNVGCISRPDASGIASQSRSPQKGCGGRNSSRRAEAPSTWVSRSETSDGARETVYLAWTTGRAGSSGEAALRSLRARLKALRVGAARP
jgi:hypothetical protein